MGGSEILSPNSNGDKVNQLQAQSSRNMSVLNIKKSSARFLNPISHQYGADTSNGVGKNLPNTVIDKYPGTSKTENALQMPPRGGIREAKNQQLFDKYVNNRQNRKISLDVSGSSPGVAPQGISNSNADNGSSSTFALPSLSNNNILNINN